MHYGNTQREVANKLLDLRIQMKDIDLIKEDKEARALTIEEQLEIAKGNKDNMLFLCQKAFMRNSSPYPL